MRAHSFETELWLPRPLEEVFAFFSDATPPHSARPGWMLVISGIAGGADVLQRLPNLLALSRLLPAFGAGMDRVKPS